MVVAMRLYCLVFRRDSKHLILAKVLVAEHQTLARVRQDVCKIGVVLVSLNLVQVVVYALLSPNNTQGAGHGKFTV